MFFGAFLTPILLLLIFNIVIYVLIIRVIILHYIQKKKRQLKHTSISTKEILKLMLSFVGIMSLFGMSWLFAIFTFVSGSDGASFAAQMMFTLLNVFQGFFVFIFFVVLNSDCREAWKSLLTPWNTTDGKKLKSKLTLSSKEIPSSSSNIYSTHRNVSNLRKRDLSQDTLKTVSTTFEEVGPDIVIDNEDVYEETTEEPVYEEYKEEVVKEKENLKPSTSKDDLSSPRIERRFTTRNTHQIEKAELDFFEDPTNDSEDDDDETKL